MSQVHSLLIQVFHTIFSFHLFALLFFYFTTQLSIYLLVFNLVTSKDKGIDNPLVALGASILFCLCAGAVYLVNLNLLLIR